MLQRAVVALLAFAGQSAIAAYVAPTRSNDYQTPASTSTIADSLHPRRYAAFYLQDDQDRIEIDGRLNDSAWEQVPFTDAFMDIQGPHHWSQPWFATRVKMRYDAHSLYIGAYVEGPEIWANETHRNAIVFHDNDFEVFVDADGSTHNYKEIEVNARNTTWNLWLNKPYRSGGQENSTRVDPENGFDMVGKGFQSAVHVDGGIINDPSQKLHYWTVEMALPLRELAKYTRVEHDLPPRAGSFWRINFSRVQWQVRVVSSVDTTSITSGPRITQHYEKISGLAESNWVWSAQYAVDMHRPEWWGYVQFRDPNEKPTSQWLVDGADSIIVPRDPLWALRLAAFQFFYAQETFKERHGWYLGYWSEELKQLVPIQEVLQWLVVEKIDLNGTINSYQAIIRVRVANGSLSDTAASIQSDSLLTLLPASSFNEEISVE